MSIEAQLHITPYAFPTRNTGRVRHEDCLVDAVLSVMSGTSTMALRGRMRWCSAVKVLMNELWHPILVKETAPWPPCATLLSRCAHQHHMNPV
ncbi:hypothetical protein PHSY_005326 [Pseudozyma hubeiensis SY62]|uniref:Uncharacterized protein n=1 Tax=Pseudozyma hubeiensis (strain SY62) TaxID=1305764 RepID=R9P8R7_PSEHS|nr:hypothetical protein PHSY_005326 [Pseudozyma hubeiensis SY62]GAC97739.1 hypothetical protein PHSY_005326 [Pseudozyma hubeiensis SY62]